MKLFLGIFLFCFPLFAFSAQPNIQLKMLSSLDRFEPFEAHLFHDGLLWVGRSRRNMAAFYRLEIYDSAGNRIAEQELKHSLRYIYPYGDHGVLVVGISATPNVSQYTIVERHGSNFVIDNHPIPETAWADRWTGEPGRMFFTDPGGNQDDPTLSTHPGLPAETIFTVVNAEPKYLQTRLRDPQHLLLLGNSLFVVSQPVITQSGATLVRVNLDTETTSAVLPTLRKGLPDMIALTNPSRLAVSENGANQVLIVDPATSRLSDTVAVAAGHPRGLAQLGNCLVVASELEKQVSFIDLSKPEHRLVSQWDLRGTGDKLYGIRDLAIDSATGRVYVRAAYACNWMGPCPTDRNSVWMAQEPSQATYRECTKPAR